MNTAHPFFVFTLYLRLLCLCPLLLCPVCI
jgi:hypothetical protein